MSRQLTRDEALRLLELPPSANGPAVKRAYRRLARRHHPDVGGDPAMFHRLRLAFERLIDDPQAQRPTVVRGRPSRAPSAWRAPETVDHTPVDLSRVDWSVPADPGQVPLDRHLAAVHLAAGDGPLTRPLRATSRSPGSRLNRVAASLSPDLTAHLLIRAGNDDRGTPMVAIEVTGSHRGARKALDRVSLDDRWVRRRGSSTTMLRTLLVPSPDRRATALRAVDRLEELLDRLDWPLPSWTMTP